MPLTKRELTISIQNAAGVSKPEAAALLDRAFEVMKATLASGEDILISGFGKFVIRKKQTRRGRNPQTGAELTIDPRQVVTFRPSGVIKARLNAK
jgi:integration host factor subunit alpha